MLCVPHAPHAQSCTFVRYTLLHLSEELLDRLHVRCSHSWLSRMLKRWRWSFKNVNPRHILKFTPRNIIYYGHYLIRIRNIPPTRIKFMDEASFSSRGTQSIIMYVHVHASMLTSIQISSFRLSSTPCCICQR